jgi:hypothetical protein
MLWNSNVFLTFKALNLTMFWALPMGIYVGIETRFNLGFATDLCVVFGSCHKDNVAIVTKTVLVYVYVFEYVRLLFAYKIIFYFVNQTQYSFILIILSKSLF